MKRTLILLTAVLMLAGGALVAGDEVSCDHGAKRAGHEGECAGHAGGEGEHACPMSGRKIASKEEISLEGRLLCLHCNLHETDSCEKVFQPAGTEMRLAICPAGDLAAAEAVAEHGEATIIVTGQRIRAEDGTEALRIASARKKS